MLTYVLFGISYGFAAAAQPGQLQAYLISRAVSNGWRRTLPAVLAPLLSDLPVIVVVLLVLTRVPPVMVSLLRLIGGVFLLYLAADAIRRWRAGGGEERLPEVPAHRTFIEAVFINLLNPNPYLGWALVLGPWLLEAWGKSAATGIALLAAFYVTLAAGSAAIVLLFSLARSFGPGVARWLLGLSGLALGVFGVWQLWAGAAAVF
ncbi:MAG: LysE family transporter [Acidobacteria bacterium]|nr:LysE family transporter [Acidobacteriota bacterium]